MSLEVEVEIKEGSKLDKKSICDWCGEEATDWIRMGFVSDMNPHGGEKKDTCGRTDCEQALLDDFADEIRDAFLNGLIL